jgi:hypothetical protein
VCHSMVLIFSRSPYSPVLNNIWFSMYLVLSTLWFICMLQSLCFFMPLVLHTLWFSLLSGSPVLYVSGSLHINYDLHGSLCLSPVLLHTLWLFSGSLGLWFPILLLHDQSPLHTLLYIQSSWPFMSSFSMMLHLTHSTP